MGFDTTVNKYDSLMEKIQSNQMIFSPSSVKQLVPPDGTPKHFINYKLKERTSTRSMEKGTLSHMVVLEPDEVENNYIIKNLKVPAAGNAENFCKAMISGMKAQEAFDFAGYKRPKGAKTDTLRVIEEKVAEKTLKTYNNYADYIKYSIKAAKEDKQVISEEEFSKAEYKKNKLYENKASRYLLDQITHCEKWFGKKGEGLEEEFKIKGHRFHGIIDGFGVKPVLDLKFTKDVSPDKFRRTFLYGYKYIIPSACYSAVFGHGKTFYFICCDDFCNIGVHRVPKAYIDKGMEYIEAALDSYNRAKLFNSWNASFDHNAGLMFNKEGHLGIHDIR